MKIDVDLPKFDIPKDFIVGDGITGDILNMYGLFPCKIKAGVFAFCTRGTIRVRQEIFRQLVMFRFLKRSQETAG